MIKGFENLKAGLLGEHLSHSFSPMIHSYLADYSYGLIEVEPEKLEEFMQKKDFDALNVTIPYKKSVMPYLDEISDEAQKIGCVNTIVKRNGNLYGYNTDYFGFMYTVKSSGVNISGKKAIILGTGGASLTVRAVLTDCGAAEIVNISRSGKDNYDNITKHHDAEIIVNATPKGMYPNTDECPIDLKDFKYCRGVFDLIYNPLKTRLICDAEDLQIPCSNGLPMLCFQAKKACEYFCNAKIDDNEALKISKIISKKTRNIALIGMASCGKTTIAKALSQKMSRDVFDTDEYIEKTNGIKISDYISQNGEEAFRDVESKALAEIAKKSGIIISTGGGIVTKERNFGILRQNSIIIFIKRNIKNLTDINRPLSQKYGIEALYEKRLPLYERFADFVIENNSSVESAINEIMKVIN